MSQKKIDIFIVNFEGAKIDNLTLSLDRETLKQLTERFTGDAAAGQERPENKQE